MPHSITIYDVTADFFSNCQHTAVDMMWDTGDHFFWSFTEAFWPVLSDEIKVATNATTCNDNGFTFIDKFINYLSITFFAAFCVTWRERSEERRVGKECS